TTGSTYTMTIIGNTVDTSTNNFRVFIDWNQDGDFADPGETYNAGSITNSTGLDDKQAVSNIAVPSDAVTGPTRMRIKKIFGSSNIDNPCVGASWGQVEDYTLIIEACTPSNWYADADEDGFGDPATMVSACEAPEGYIADSSDCDDTMVMYADNDEDGFGSDTMVACDGVSNSEDCDDTMVMYADNDEDGFGTDSMVACDGVENTDDCDDTNASINPGAAEIEGNGIDENCNGMEDDEVAGEFFTQLKGNVCGTTLARIYSSV